MKDRISAATLCRPLAALLALALATATGVTAAQALTPAFTYQGELRLTSGPATGNFDMQFRLYNAQEGGSQLGTTLIANSVATSGGLFSVPLDFGPAQFAGEPQWLEIAIRPAGSGSYETLSPRTELTAAPYAWGAAAALANSVTTTSIVDGTVATADLANNAVTAAKIDAAQVQRRVTGSCPTGQYVRIVAQDGSVTCSTDAAGSGTVTSIATGAGLTGGPITTSGTIEVAAGGIGTTEINQTQVQRRVTGTCSGTNYVQQVNQDGSVACGAAPAASGWLLAGNAGTNPATNFLGTTDNQPLVLRTANAQSLRIEPSLETFGSPALPITTNTIAGSHANEVTAGVRGATIAGGGVPTGLSDPDFVSESPNRVTDHYGTVGGGYGNRAGDDAGSLADRAFATVGGGLQNTASGSRSTVGGGSFNTASGEGGTVGGGQSNCAGGARSWAGGRQAKVRPATSPGSGSCSGLPSYPGGTGDAGTFVWADNQGADFVSTSDNQFLVRADGGFGFNTNDIPAGIEAVFHSRTGPNGNVDLYLKTAAHGRGINLAMQPGAGAAAFYISQYDGTSFVDRILLASNGDFSVTAQAFKPGGGSWAAPSDARLKSDVTLLAGSLDKLLALRGVEYAYRPEATPKSMYLPGRQVGFVAQEVEQVFPDWVSETDEGYKIVGPRGFEALTVEALRELRAESAAIDGGQRDRIAALEAENAVLRARLDRLEALLTGDAGVER